MARPRIQPRVSLGVPRTENLLLCSDHSLLLHQSHTELAQVRSIETRLESEEELTRNMEELSKERNLESLFLSVSIGIVLTSTHPMWNTTLWSVLTPSHFTTRTVKLLNGETEREREQFSPQLNFFLAKIANHTFGMIKFTSSSNRHIVEEGLDVESMAHVSVYFVSPK